VAQSPGRFVDRATGRPVLPSRIVPRGAAVALVGMGRYNFSNVSYFIFLRAQAT